MASRARTTPAFIGVFLGLLAALPGAASTQTFTNEELAAAQALRDKALQSPLALELVTSLTTEVGPRLAGTAGDRAAVEWAVRNLKRLGFSNVRTMEVIVPRWSRGTAEVSITEPFPQPLTAVALGGSIGTHDEGIHAEVIQVPDVDTLSRMTSEQVAGRIVYFSERMQRTQNASGYSKAVAKRNSGPAVAASKGAVAAIVRSAGTSNHRFAHTGGTRYTIGSPRIPAVSISNPDADLLERQLASGKPVRISMHLTARDLPQTRSANVIGEIPGDGKADEIVLLGAHLDSWDLGTGALDDGAGVAIVTAAAKLIADMKPRARRTIRVVLFANEEFGLSGSNTYLEQEANALPQHAMAMEADLGAGPVYQLDSRVDARQWPYIEQIASILSPLGVALGGNNGTGGSDIAALVLRGVPTITPRLDATNYFDYHHTANDTLDKVDPKHLAQATASYAVAAYLAARAEQQWIHLPERTAAPSQ